MKDDSIYLLHIRDALNRIFDYTAGGEENFLQDTKTQDTVVRIWKLSERLLSTSLKTSGRRTSMSLGRG